MQLASNKFIHINARAGYGHRVWVHCNAPAGVLLYLKKASCWNGHDKIYTNSHRMSWEDSIISFEISVWGESEQIQEVISWLTTHGMEQLTTHEEVVSVFQTYQHHY